MILEAPIVPVAKPRMTQRDKWRSRDVVVRYRCFCDAARLYANQQNFVLSPGMYYRFWIPVPKSWSKKKKLKMEGTPHRQKPDLDNYIKAVWDALCREDSHIWSIGSAEKRWSKLGFIQIWSEHDY